MIRTTAVTEIHRRSPEWSTVLTVAYKEGGDPLVFHVKNSVAEIPLRF
jgi:hypothetical protein